MSLQIIELSEAVSDVMGAADYIAAQSSLNASEKFLDAVKSAYQKIADMPGIGTVRDYGQSELREMRMWRVPKILTQSSGHLLSKKIGMGKPTRKISRKAAWWIFHSASVVSLSGQSFRSRRP